MQNRVVWTPQPRQEVFMSRGEDEALYGGAAGGGKSDALVIEATRQVHIPYYKGLILRKTYPQLAELIDKSLNYYRQAFPQATYNASSHTWTFPSGAKIIFGSLQHSKDKLNYQGQAYDFIGFDELTHFLFDEYIYLASRNRPNGPGTRCYMRATANPGGIGHGWVKERFITAAKPMTTIWEDAEVIFPDGHKETRSKSRIFVPSSVFDNKILMDNDPNYITRLASMPEAEKNALLYGDWDSYSGQYFNLKNDSSHYDDMRWTHVINPFDIPKSWKIYRGFDWGYNHPFACGWYAISGEDDINGAGTMYHILEFYGCTGVANQGVKWTADRVFKEIYRIEHEHPWLKDRQIIGIADPAIWNAEYGESIAETASKCRVYFSKGDHQRIPGWLQCQYRLSFSEEGIAKFYVFTNCKHFIRSIPTLVFDETRVEDVDTRGEDHIADSWRYVAMQHIIEPRADHKADEYNLSPMAQILDIPKDNITKRIRKPRMEIIK